MVDQYYLTRKQQNKMEAGEDFDQAPKAPKPVSNQISVVGRTVGGNIDNFGLITKSRF